MTVVPFSPQKLLRAIAELPSARRYWIAYSGGLDSHVLLHSLAALRERLPVAELAAVHVDHGLSPAAAAWARHCAEVCEGLKVPLTLLRVDARPRRGESPEAAARNARYRAIEPLLGEGDGLLTAHHQDDQAETVLLQALRGSGPRGLAAMPVWNPFGEGWQGRPLLGFRRDELRAHARAEGLCWVEDESNFDTGIARNYLRHEVVPRLRRRWPAMATTLSRVASHAADAAHLLDQLAAQDLVVAEDGGLEIGHLAALDAARQRNLLRYWIHRSGLPVPDAVHLQRVLDEVIPAAPDALPRVAWTGAELRRYRSRLYLMPPLPAHDASQVFEWRMEGPLHLPDGGILRAVPVLGGGMARDLRSADCVTVRFRRGGERCRPAGVPYTRKLKKLLQERGIPPWLRERIPLLYLGEELAAVADLFVCAPFHARDGEPGLRIEWQRPPFLMGPS